MAAIATVDETQTERVLGYIETGRDANRDDLLAILDAAFARAAPTPGSRPSPSPACRAGG